MRTHYDTIYLSPHLDDAALSCGGQIFGQTAVGKSVLIVTIMAGDPLPAPLTEFADSLHKQWQLFSDIVAARRAEDVAACQVLGADYVHWTIPDCIYRLHPETGAPLYESAHQIFGEIHPAEAGLIDRLARQMADLPGYERIVAPLTVGHHVDHQLVRLASERGLEAGRLRYYEDYPYVRDDGALAAVISAEQAGWQPEVIRLRQADVAARVEAIGAFNSQLSTFFNGRADLEQQILAYTTSVGGERIWYRQPNERL